MSERFELVKKELNSCQKNNEFNCTIEKDSNTIWVIKNGFKQSGHQTFDVASKNVLERESKGECEYNRPTCSIEETDNDQTWWLVIKTQNSFWKESGSLSFNTIKELSLNFRKLGYCD